MGVRLGELHRHGRGASAGGEPRQGVKTRTRVRRARQFLFVLSCSIALLGFVCLLAFFVRNVLLRCFGLCLGGSGDLCRSGTMCNFHNTDLGTVPRVQSDASGGYGPGVRWNGKGEWYGGTWGCTTWVQGFGTRVRYTRTVSKPVLCKPGYRTRRTLRLYPSGVPCIRMTAVPPSQTS